MCVGINESPACRVHKSLPFSPPSPSVSLSQARIVPSALPRRHAHSDRALRQPVTLNLHSAAATSPAAAPTAPQTRGVANRTPQSNLRALHFMHPPTPPLRRCGARERRRRWLLQRALADTRSISIDANWNNEFRGNAKAEHASCIGMPLSVFFWFSAPLCQRRR